MSVRLLEDHLVINLFSYRKEGRRERSRVLVNINTILATFQEFLAIVLDKCKKVCIKTILIEKLFPAEAIFQIFLWTFLDIHTGCVLKNAASHIFVIYGSIYIKKNWNKTL
jgi:hypothetical protein